MTTGHQWRLQELPRRLNIILGIIIRLSVSPWLTCYLTMYSVYANWYQRLIQAWLYFGPFMVIIMISLMELMTALFVDALMATKNANQRHQVILQQTRQLELQVRVESKP